MTTHEPAQPMKARRASLPELLGRHRGAAVAAALFLAGALWMLENLRQFQSSLIRLAYMNWVKREVLDKNPVAITGFAGGEPGWWGEAFLSIQTLTPAGKPISVQLYVASGPLGTRVGYIDLYAADRSKSRSVASSRKRGLSGLFHPTGRTVHLPVDSIRYSRPVDLRKLLPEAFAEATKAD